MNLGWYWRRLSRMSGQEVLRRAETVLRQAAWRSGAGRPALRPGRLLAGPRKAMAVLPPCPPGVSAEARGALLAYADGILAGDWPIFETARHGVALEPDWFLDPVTGIRAPQQLYCFAVPHRQRDRVGDLKHVWEPSRHQATLALATAWWLTGEARYAEAVARHLTSWWRDNPYLCGIHWTSGIELGLRLLSWAWIRALLEAWPGRAALFEENPLFLDQLYGHQRYLAAFESSASSSNNHLLAELAGLAVAATAFPWFVESAAWARRAGEHLCREAERQTAPDGLNVEQAAEYHRFVLELLWSAGLAEALAGSGFPQPYWATILRMSVALRDSLDSRGRDGRFGDADGGRGLAFDAPATDPVAALLGAARLVFDESAPSTASIFETICAASGFRSPAPMPAPTRASVAFVESGHIFLRSGVGAAEIQLHCDCGPLGYLSIAAHGHADALSVELRVGGVDILADPGTFLYHTDPPRRRAFRSTLGHNTLELDGRDQAEYGGSFLWMSRTTCRIDALELSASAPLLLCEAQHDGYQRLADPATHHRRTTLDPAARQVQIDDWLDAGTTHPAALAFHLGPTVRAELAGAAADLSWDDPAGSGGARLSLPESLVWTAHRGETEPPLGWYSRHYGHLEPTTVLIGRGALAPGARLTTRIAIDAA
jgi:hypothetical protein